MKRLIALTCAVLMIGFSLCACSDEAVNKVKQTASEAMSDIKKDMTQNGNDKNGATDDRERTEAPTTAENMTEEDLGDRLETEWNDMVENGEVEDGDGNVGELENNDGDGNVDNDAVN